MNNSIKATGKCLCGFVEIRSESISTDVGACHCNMCRKWSAGPFLAVECQGEVQISGEDNVSTFNSSEWAERGFCSKCGTHLFYRLKANNLYVIPAGLFDEEPQFNFDHQVFIDEKPQYYTFSNETKNMTGEELFALFAGE